MLQNQLCLASRWSDFWILSALLRISVVGEAWYLVTCILVANRHAYDLQDFSSSLVNADNGVACFRCFNSVTGVFMSSVTLVCYFAVFRHTSQITEET